MKQAEVDANKRAGASTDIAAKLKALEHGNRKLGHRRLRKPIGNIPSVDAEGRHHALLDKQKRAACLTRDGASKRCSFQAPREISVVARRHDLALQN